MIEATFLVTDRVPLPARRLDNLVQQVLKVNKTEAIRVIQTGGVSVNDRAATRPLSTIEVGDQLSIQYQPIDHRPAPSRRELATEMRIVYQDEHLVVVDKPPGVLTVPTPRRERNTLIDLLGKQLRYDGTGQEAFCAHRLDRGVSGLLVFGKRLEVAKLLRDQFAERKPKRFYVAIVAGTLTQQSGTFRSHLATDANLNRYSTDDGSGQLAITHFRVLDRMTDATSVEVSLETGRRNQIRVHFAQTGHPVLGDSRYGREELPNGKWLHNRLALHARTLGFTHPISGQSLEFQSPLPLEMRNYLREAGIVTRDEPRPSSPQRPPARPSSKRSKRRRS